MTLSNKTNSTLIYKGRNKVFNLFIKFSIFQNEQQQK
jgi:hypothetical protein